MILFLMLLCTTYCLHGMNGSVDDKRGTFTVIAFDQIYSNHATDDGKGGSNISYTGSPLCLVGKFKYTDNSLPEEELMVPIDRYRSVNGTDIDRFSDQSCLVVQAHRSSKIVSLFMSKGLKDKLKEALGK